MINPFLGGIRTIKKVYVFKTNIKSELDLNIIKSSFSSNPNIIKWSVDIEDIDNVLRIEAKKNLSKKDIINEITSKGLHCEELE